MIKEAFKRLQRAPYIKEIGAVAIIAVAVFITVSLMSYSPHDSSWFFYSTQAGSVQNLCGVVGAHIAALFFYILGASSLFLVIGMLFAGIVMLSRISLAEEWDRLVATGVLMLTCAAFSSLYGIDFLNTPHPGGLIGSALYGGLHYLFDDVGSIIFLHTLLLISFVIITRFSFISAVQCLVVGTQFMHDNQWFIPPIYKTVRFAMSVVAFPFIWVATFAKRICDGSVIKDADYSMDEFDQDLIESSAMVSSSMVSSAMVSSAMGKSSTDRSSIISSWMSLQSVGTPPAGSQSSGSQSAGSPSAGSKSSESPMMHDPAEKYKTNVAQQIDLDEVLGEVSLSEAIATAIVNREAGHGVDVSAQGESVSGEPVFDELSSVLADIEKLESGSTESVSAKGVSTESGGTEGEQQIVSQQGVAQSVVKKKSYSLPSLDIFIGPKDGSEDRVLMKTLEVRAKILEEKLERFGVKGAVVSIKRGPVVTLFEYQPEIDTKISKIIALEDDLSLALQALSIRIIAPIPGRAVVGFEVANKDRRTVSLASVIQSDVYKNFDGALPLILGEDTVGNNILIDLAKMPHLLIAGSTGSGKSVALNAMLVSLLCARKPEELHLILIDPKRLEFACYADIAHLLFPIVVDPKKAAPVLQWVVQQMEERYEKMAQVGSRNFNDYNKWAEKQMDEEKLPMIVVVIDELADLMMTTGKVVEDLIARIAQMARAAGIHLIIATQRPSVDVITGLIKVNFPSRISFRVTSKVDSRTILDASGAEKLLGRGDMLFLNATGAGMQRVHGAYVSDAEIDKLVSHIRSEQKVKYLNIMEELAVKEDNGLSDSDSELYQDVIAFLEKTDDVSISLLQRKFRIGYNRSARIIDKLETQGIIMPADGGKTRKVIR